MQNSLRFTISGIVAISIYAFICFLFLSYIIKPKTKTYIVPKQTVIELDMIVEKSDKLRVEKKVEKIIEPKEIVKKETSISAKPTPDLKSLFGKVKIKEKKVEKKIVQNIKKSTKPKRYKAKFQREKKSSNVSVDKLLNDTKTTTKRKNRITSKSKGESDEYFSKVNELLNQWIPKRTKDGLKARVIVKIDNRGNFDYKFKSFSGDTNFDDSLKAFLEEQKSVKYPIPKNNKSVEIGVDFKSEG